MQKIMAWLEQKHNQLIQRELQQLQQQQQRRERSSLIADHAQPNLPDITPVNYKKFMKILKESLHPAWRRTQDFAVNNSVFTPATTDEIRFYVSW